MNLFGISQRIFCEALSGNMSLEDLKKRLERSGEKLSGCCIAMKGDKATSKRALSPLGGRLAKIEAVQLPGIPDPHYLFVIEKTRCLLRLIHPNREHRLKHRWHEARFQRALSASYDL